MHYDRWLQEEANELAEKVGQPLPYPNVKPLGIDTGERFLHEYFVEQVH